MKSHERSHIAEGKSALATWIPIVISVAAFSVSLFTWYYEHWRERHSLKAVIARIDWNQEQIPVEVLVRNMGNKTEVVTGIQLIYGPEIEKGGGTVPAEHAAPVVIKPDETAVLTFNTKRPSLADLRDHHQLDPENGLHIGVICSIVDFYSGETKNKIYRTSVIPFTVLHYDDSGRLTGASPAKGEKSAFKELYEGQPEE